MADYSQKITQASQIIANAERRAKAHNNRTQCGFKLEAADILAQIIEQRGQCQICEKEVWESYHVDHIMPVTLGGINHLSNISILCPLCNSRKSGTHPFKYLEKLRKHNGLG